MQKSQVINNFITVDKNIRFGEPCFEGTRIPVNNIFEYLHIGWSIDRICKNFPAIKKESLATFIKEIGNDIRGSYV